VNPEDTPVSDPENHSYRAYLNPVVAIAVAILLSVFILIGAAIAGWDKGVLSGMSRVEYARGVITYLFAIVTIGTAVVLIVSALISSDDPRNERRFERGKEILSLLLGVFGTIVGFYFGSELSARGQLEEQNLRVIPVHLSKTQLDAKSPFTLSTFVSGGQEPYRFGVAFGDATPQVMEKVQEKGWITKDLLAPEVATETDVVVKIVVKDAAGHTAEQSAAISVKPPH
jgi:uncharacterized membrane protein